MYHKRIRLILRTLGLFVLTLVLVEGCQPQKPRQTLIIAAASNLQYALKEVVEQFEQKEGISCEVIFASSGKLTAQIEQGAPYDVFLSANKKYADYLSEKNLTATPTLVFAYGALVLWSGNESGQISINSVLETSAKHIAIANPKLAPYGEAAIQALKYQKLYDTIKGKLVFGEHIGQVNQFMYSQSADMGITSKSSVMHPKIANKGTWVAFPAESYAPITQSVMVLKNNPSSPTKNEMKFYKYLFSEEAQQILVKFGYSRYDAGD